MQPNGEPTPVGAAQACVPDLAARPLRWTTSARDQAVRSLGGTGKVLFYADAALRGRAILAFLVFVSSVFRT
jgi:hypothetical protein